MASDVLAITPGGMGVNGNNPCRHPTIHRSTRRCRVIVLYTMAIQRKCTDFIPCPPTPTVLHHPTGRSRNGPMERTRWRILRPWRAIILCTDLVTIIHTFWPLHPSRRNLPIRRIRPIPHQRRRKQCCMLRPIGPTWIKPRFPWDWRLREKLLLRHHVARMKVTKSELSKFKGHSSDSTTMLMHR